MPEEVVASGPGGFAARAGPPRSIDLIHSLGQARWPEGEIRGTRERRGFTGPTWLAGLALAAAILLGGAALASTYGPHLSVDSAIVGVGDALSVLAPFPVAFALGVFFPRWAGLGRGPLDGGDIPSSVRVMSTRSSWCSRSGPGSPG